MKLYEGLKVIDITNNVAGPTIGQWLGEYGAEVIHVEKPVIGDDSRHFPPVSNGESMFYSTLNHGKKSIAVNLKDPDGCELIKKLCVDADILIESNRPGVMKRLGLDYEVIHEINPRLIYCSVSAYGQTGPNALRPGYDIIAQGASGLVYYNGEADSGPVINKAIIGDLSSAVMGFGAVNAALYYRERTGKGQQVDIALTRVMTYFGANFDERLIYNRKAIKGSSNMALLSPYGMYRCPDGEYIIIACANNALTFKFFDCIGRPELKYDPRFGSNEKRVQNNDIMFGILMEWLGEMRTADNAAKALENAGIPYTRVYDYDDVLNDPHYNECGWFTDVPMPESFTEHTVRKVVNAPFKLSEVEPEYKPMNGFAADTKEVLTELGSPEEKIRELIMKIGRASCRERG